MCYSMLIPTITLQQNTARGWISVGALLQSTGVKMKYKPVQFEGLSVAKLENSGLLPRLDYTISLANKGHSGTIKLVNLHRQSATLFFNLIWN